MGGLNRYGCEEGLVAAFTCTCSADMTFEMLNEYVSEAVCLIPRKPCGYFTVTAMDVGFLLIVVVLISHPIIKTTSSLRRNIMGARIRTIKMPLADPGGMVSGLLQGGGQRRDGWIESGWSLIHSRVMGIPAGQKRASEGRAPWSTRHGAVETHAVPCEVVNVWRANIGVSRVAKRLGSVLVSKNPNDVWPLATVLLGGCN